MDDERTFDLAVIGGGNMGAALLGGLLASGAVPASSVEVVEPSVERRVWLSAEFPGVTVLEWLAPCRAAVIAVKPPDAAAVAAAAARAGARRVVSIAAGIHTSTLVDAVGDPGVAVLRSMPNTPSLVGHGMAAVTGAPGVREVDLVWAEGILTSVGRCVRVDESDFDAVTALTGSGPAYVFLVAEALVAAGVDAGLPAALADEMVTQLLVGSSALLADRGDPAGLRAMVTSPGGTTAAGIAALEAHGLRDAVLAAVRAAAERSRQLGA